jgi:hypothetical protein
VLALRLVCGGGAYGGGVFVEEHFGGGIGVACCFEGICDYSEWMRGNAQVCSVGCLEMEESRCKRGVDFPCCGGPCGMRCTATNGRRARASATERATSHERVRHKQKSPVQVSQSSPPTTSRHFLPISTQLSRRRKQYPKLHIESPCRRHYLVSGFLVEGCARAER